MATLAEWKASLKSSHAALTKNVDGVRSTLNTAEYNATIDAWAQASYDKEVADDIRTNGGASANYATYRVEAYPSIGDQLDMQYKDALNGTTTWKDAITAIKTKYRKA